MLLVAARSTPALHPDGYNIGVNAGEAAGQTVMHLHVHVIPRFRGDVDDPRGGVRHVIPGKGNYLAPRPAPLTRGGTDQAAKTFRRLLRDRAPRFGWFAGNAGDLEGAVVFASVQKLSRPEHLARLVPGSFDYAIVDEVHHGTAPSYRSILDRIEPAFLLGLTATPERADGADVIGLFDDHVAYRADRSGPSRLTCATSSAVPAPHGSRRAAP